MKYIEWAQEYLCEAHNVANVIERKKELLSDDFFSEEQKLALQDTIRLYINIYNELITLAQNLFTKAKEEYQEGNDD